MLVAGGDIETTGFNTPEHRIVEVYIGLWDSDTRILVDTYFQRIDPERPIPAEAQRVHGITAADVAGKPNWFEVAGELRAFLRRADVIVGHNWLDFDGPFIDRELKRIGLDPVVKPVIDTTHARWATPNGKVPNLQELCFACEVPYDPALAHKADYDVGVMMEAFFRGIDWGFFQYHKDEHDQAA